ncbi:MAG: aminomethyl-transferring glycine dehydrogenase subunit GcvPA [Dorea sp.]
MNILSKKGTFVHPYMPNSVPEIKQAMLDEIGVESVEEIYKSLIPDDLLYKERLDIPEPIVSEYELKKHVMGLLNKNATTEEYTSFLGAGCYKHQVPAICDELNSRGEFLTAYCGDTYSDHGKMQAIFEYTSMMGELLDADVVSYTTYDAGQSVASSIRMALRVKEAEGKKKSTVLVPATMNPEILSQVKSYCKNIAAIVQVASDEETGCMDMKDLAEKLSTDDVAAVFVENPSYLGFFEVQAEKIGEMAHAHDSLYIVQPEVASLGIVESPMNMGADIVCGDIQPLGMHMQFGGGQAGFIACDQNLEIVQQFPTYMYGIAKTEKEGRFGWGRAMNYRCSHGSRENANEYFGTETGLWGITAGIYLASMGPKGMYELGASILQKTQYAILKLGEIENIKVNVFGGANFQEFVINFDETGKTVKEINKKLLEKKIFGGKDLSEDFPQYGQSALYCISELTTEEEIETLKTALEEIVRGC